MGKQNAYQGIGVRRHILVVAKNVRGPIEKKKWVGVVMYVNNDVGVSGVEAECSAIG